MSLQQQQQLFSRIRHSFRRQNHTTKCNSQLDSKRTYDEAETKQSSNVQKNNTVTDWFGRRQYISQLELQKSSQPISSTAKQNVTAKTDQSKCMPNIVAATGVSSSTTSMNSVADSMVLVSESTLGELTKQLTSSLNRMKQIEEQVKIIPELKQRLDYIISNCSDDDQPSPKAPLRATSNEFMCHMRRKTTIKPSVSLSDNRNHERSNPRPTHQRYVSSSCDYDNMKDAGDFSTKSKRIADSYSLGSIRPQDHSVQRVEANKVNSNHILHSQRSLFKNEEYDDIISDLLSLFDSFDVEANADLARANNCRSSFTKHKPDPSSLTRQSSESTLVERSSLSLPHLTDKRMSLSKNVIAMEPKEPVNPIRSTLYKSAQMEPVAQSIDTQQQFYTLPSNKTIPIEHQRHCIAQDESDFKTYLTINSVGKTKRDSMTQTELVPELNSKNDFSTNTDLFMDELVTRKQLNELLMNLKLTPKQTARCLSICGRLESDSLDEDDSILKKKLRPSRNKSQDSSDESDDHTLSIGDTYSVCSSHEDLSGFEGYFNIPKLKRDIVKHSDHPRELFAEVI